MLWHNWQTEQRCIGNTEIHTLPKYAKSLNCAALDVPVLIQLDNLFAWSATLDLYQANLKPSWDYKNRFPISSKTVQPWHNDIRQFPKPCYISINAVNIHILYFHTCTCNRLKRFKFYRRENVWTWYFMGW